MVFRDVTEDRGREDYARYLGRIMGQALNEIYFLEPASLRFGLVNEGARQKLGYTAAQLAQMSLPEVLPGISTEDVQALLAPLRTGAKQEIVFETRVRPANGDSYPVEICMQYFADEQPPIFVAIVHPTSEREQLGGDTPP